MIHIMHTYSGTELGMTNPRLVFIRIVYILLISTVIVTTRADVEGKQDDLEYQLIIFFLE